MATFKVGQRVRITSDGAAPERRAGSEGTILHEAEPPSDPRYIPIVGPAPYYLVRVDNVPGEDGWEGWRISHVHLAPLTDPGADAFLEKIRKLKPYDEPQVIRGKGNVLLTAEQFMRGDIVRR